MVLLRITQRTQCRYSRPVQIARIEFRLFPVSSTEQTILKSSVAVEPPCPLVDFTDAWGNGLRKAEWSEPIDQWRLSVDLHVETHRSNPFDFSSSAADLAVPADPGWWPVEVHGYLRWEYDPWDNDPTVAAWARSESAAAAGGFNKILILMRSIHAQFKFLKGFTDIKTPPGEILRIKVGVCQDFSTLLIAAARSLGLPARYVSGYIYEGPKSKRGGPAPTGHGWAEVYFPEIGWRGFDPLNGILACHTHVRVAQGRWYADAAPVLGRFIGIGIEQTTETAIEVDMTDGLGRSVEAT